MRRFAHWRMLLAAAAAAAALVVIPSAAASSVVNGDFETGDLTGWTQDGIGPIEWDTFSNFDGLLAPHGQYAAGVDEGGPSAAVLYQTLHLGSGKKKLRMYVFYANFAGRFCTPPSLTDGIEVVKSPAAPYGPTPKDGIGVCNQQFRIDIMRPDADPFSVAPSDVIKNLVWTLGGSPFFGPKKMTFSLKGLTGDVMLRLGLADNLYYFFAGVDQVQLLG